MEFQTDLEPFSERSQRSALNLVEKMLRNNFLNYYRPTNERLKTYKSFLSTVHDLYDTFDIPTPNCQVFPQEFNLIMCQATLESHLDLVKNVGKQFPIQSDLKSVALATIHCRYPLDKWFHKYTDGSAEDAIKNFGAGAFSSAFSIRYPVGKYCDNFDGEIAAISFVIDKLERCSECNIVFFIDSQAAISSLINSKYNENALVHSCRMKLIELRKCRENIALQWIPSHCNVSGNEKADRLAKAGSLMTDLSLLCLCVISKDSFTVNCKLIVFQYGDAAAGISYDKSCVNEKKMSVAHRTLECPVFSQLLPKKKSKSRAWEHFGLPANESGQIVSEDIAVCKLCGSQFQQKSGSTSNLFGHLRLHHPLQFSEVSNKSKVVTATVQYSPFCAAVDESIDEPQPQSSMAVSKSNQFNFVDNHRHKRQKFMTDFQRLDDQASKRTTDSVTKFLVCTMQPYNLVDRKELINMVKVLNPRYSLPGRKHFTATAVPKLYNEVRDKIRQELSLINKDTISVTTDCWTSIANTPYITITVHFITSEWALKSACLACAHFDDDHNGKNIAEVLRSILNDWGIDVQNIMSITTDNGRNILKTIEELNLENAHISCFAHNINIGLITLWIFLY
ncbi:zinc finger BED domain-containing protein 1 [Trichonephila clavipes]|nr:zinc finger BED domain-containing protein 1 [Trichonephila clavipes]